MYKVAYISMHQNGTLEPRGNDSGLTENRLLLFPLHVKKVKKKNRIHSVLKNVRNARGSAKTTVNLTDAKVF